MTAARLVPSYKLLHLRSAVITAMWEREKSPPLSLTHALGTPRRKLKVIDGTKLTQRTPWVTTSQSTRPRAEPSSSVHSQVRHQYW